MLFTFNSYGIQYPSSLRTYHHLPLGRGEKTWRDTDGKFSWARHNHCYLHSTIQISVTWPHLTTRENRKCSPGVCRKKTYLAVYHIELLRFHIFQNESKKYWSPPIKSKTSMEAALIQYSAWHIYWSNKYLLNEWMIITISTYL